MDASTSSSTALCESSFAACVPTNPLTQYTQSMQGKSRTQSEGVPLQMTLGERNSRQSFYHYLPVDDPAMRWGSYPTGAGRSVILPGQPYPPRERPSLYDCEWRHGQTLPEFAIILITGGRGVFESRQSGQTPIESGSVLVLFPGVWRRYRPDPKTGWTERWLSFNSEIPRQLVRLHLLSSENPLRKVAHADRLEASFDRLLDRIHAHPSQNSILLSMRFMTVLADVIEQLAEKSSLDGVEDNLVAQAMELIWMHSHRDLSVTRIARSLAVTRQTIGRRFQAATGRTLIGEIARCRLIRAKRLLTETDLAMKAIARLSGFPSEDQMRVVFRQQERTSPSEYRRRAIRGEKARPQP